MIGTAGSFHRSEHYLQGPLEEALTHTGPPVWSHLIAFIALTLEGPHCIDALAISAKVPISSCTFINICQKKDPLIYSKENVIIPAMIKTFKGKNTYSKF